MVANFRKRIGIARKILARRWVSVALQLWGLAAAYDTLVSQFFPETLAKRAPKIRELIEGSSGWLPWWGWCLLLAGIISIACFEYAVRRSGQPPLSTPSRIYGSETWMKPLDAIDTFCRHILRPISCRQKERVNRKAGRRARNASSDRGRDLVTERARI